MTADSAEKVLEGIANAWRFPLGYTAADKLREIALNERLRVPEVEDKELLCFYRNVE